MTPTGIPPAGPVSPGFTFLHNKTSNSWQRKRKPPKSAPPNRRQKKPLQKKPLQKRGQRKKRQRKRPLLNLLGRYWPGPSSPLRTFGYLMEIVQMAAKSSSSAEKVVIKGPLNVVNVTPRVIKQGPLTQSHSSPQRSPAPRYSLPPPSRSIAGGCPLRSGGSGK